MTSTSSPKLRREATFDRTQLDALLELGAKGICELSKLQSAAIQAALAEQ